MDWSWADAREPRTAATLDERMAVLWAAMRAVHSAECWGASWAAQMASVSVVTKVCKLAEWMVVHSVHLWVVCWVGQSVLHRAAPRVDYLDSTKADEWA